MWRTVHKLNYLSKIIRKSIFVDLKTSSRHVPSKLLPKKQVTDQKKLKLQQTKLKLNIFRLNKFAMNTLPLLTSWYDLWMQMIYPYLV